MAQSSPHKAEYEYEYDDALDALVVTVRGIRTFEQANSHFAEVMTRLKREETVRLLLDLSEVRYAFDLDEAVEAFIRISAQSVGNQIAIVLDASQREKGIVMQTAATVRWNLVRLFRDRGEAEAWLRDTGG